MDTITGIILGLMVGILASMLIIASIADNRIKNDLISYKYLYDHNITYEQVPDKQYAKYILKRKYKESLKNLEKGE
jgi:hypothetical protein